MQLICLIILIAFVVILSIEVKKCLAKVLQSGCIFSLAFVGYGHSSNEIFSIYIPNVSTV